MSDVDIGIGDQLRAAWSQAQDAADRAVEKIRLETAARQADAWTALQARQASFPENRVPQPPADGQGLREALMVAQGALKAAELRLRDALEAGSRGQSHCDAIRQRLLALDIVERKHAGSLAAVLRSGGSGSDLSPALIEARAARPGVERDAAAADQACAELAADIARAQSEADAAMVAVRAAAKAVMGGTARTIADRILEHEQAAAKLWHELEPLGVLYFAGAKGTPGSPISLDEAVRKVFSARPRLSGTDNIPPAQQAANAAAASDAWRQYFDALSTDPDAQFGTDGEILQ